MAKNERQTEAEVRETQGALLLSFHATESRIVHRRRVEPTLLLLLLTLSLTSSVDRDHAIGGAHTPAVLLTILPSRPRQARSSALSLVLE